MLKLIVDVGAHLDFKNGGHDGDLNSCLNHKMKEKF